MKRTALKRIIIWAVVCTLLAATMIVGMAASRSARESFEGIHFGPAVLLEEREGSTEGAADFDPSQVKEIIVKWTSGAVRVGEAEGKNISVSERNTDSKRPLCWKLEGETLTIYPYKGGGWFFFNLPSKTLELQLPKGYRPEMLTIDGASADYSAEGVTVGTLDINTASGDVTLKSVKADEADIDTASGDVFVDADIADFMRIDTASGEVNVNGSYRYGMVNTVSGNQSVEIGEATQSLSIDTVSGNIGLSLKGAKGISLNRSTVSGDFICTLGGRYESESYVYGDGSVDIDVNTVSGNVSVD